LATQNPIDQEGTYLLPEAQSDRFMLKCKIDYPKFEDERSDENDFYFASTNQKSGDLNQYC
jgi:MoxR-like ATPase